MELLAISQSLLGSYCSLSPTRPSKPNSPPLSSSVIKFADTNFSSSSCFKGLKLPIRKPQTIAAVVGDAIGVPNDSLGELSVDGKQPYPGANSDKNGEQKDDDLGDQRMVRVCDKLIEVFMVDKPTPTDWRRLLAFSKEWSTIGPHFYNRCQERAENEENPEMQHKLFRLGRKLKEIDEDVQRHNELLEVVRSAPSEVGEVVARRRKDFTKEFFLHLHTVAESYYDNPTEQNEIAKLGNACLAAVQAFDIETESIEAQNAAELKFQDLINSPSVDAAYKKIDNLVEKNQLDSALMLRITKAWSAAKESNLMKDEAKDILYHLYMTSRANLQRLVPKEIRIVKYLITIEDPEMLLCALKDAFTPGEELEGQDVDNLYTTPENLHDSIKAVVDAYHFSTGGALREARDLMNPAVIQKLEKIQNLVKDNFM